MNIIRRNNLRVAPSVWENNGLSRASKGSWLDGSSCGVFRATLSTYSNPGSKWEVGIINMYDYLSSDNG